MEERMNRLRALAERGTAVWLDFLSREIIDNGHLQKLIDDDGLAGVTANPSIFEKAMGESDAYDAGIARLVGDGSLSVTGIYEKLATADIAAAADKFRPLYDRSEGRHGFVSLEVSPYLAMDTAATMMEARRLWTEVQRENIFIKVPATPPGIPAIRDLLAEGINVNITLMFTVSQYQAVAEAYLRGMERTPDPRRVTSVASFFVSRIDTAVDRALEEIGTPEALALRGKAGIANATLAYHRFREIFFSPEFEKMRKRGVRIQKPLWASTSTKNKAYSDVMYIEGLLAPDSINSMPPETLEAFLDHGKARIALDQNSAEAARDVVGQLVGMGIALKSVGQELTDEGVEKFIQSYDELIDALEKKRAALARTEAA